MIYRTDASSREINTKLQDTFNRIQSYYANWKLKINTSKCETILFRRTTNNATTEVRRNLKKFRLKDRLKQEEPIPHKETVKYLGINLDDKVSFTKHIDIKIRKTKEACAINRSLFSSKFFNERVKLIAYMCLIRPIITYGCPIWFNLTAARMEVIRKLERRCLRVCVGFINSRDKDTLKFKSNKDLYNRAAIVRIDNHIVKITRNHFAAASANNSNTIINNYDRQNEDLYRKILMTKYIPPEAFIYLDKHGYRIKTTYQY